LIVPDVERFKFSFVSEPEEAPVQDCLVIVDKKICRFRSRALERSSYVIALEMKSVVVRVVDANKNFCEAMRKTEGLDVTEITSVRLRY